MLLVTRLVPQRFVCIAQLLKLGGVGFWEFHLRLLAPLKPGALGVVELGDDIDPLPALRPDGGGMGFQCLEHQPVEQTSVQDVTRVAAVEEVAADGTSGGLIGIEPDEADPLVARRYLPVGERLADGAGVAVVRVRPLQTRSCAAWSSDRVNACTCSRLNSPAR